MGIGVQGAAASHQVMHAHERDDEQRGDEHAPHQAPLDTHYGHPSMITQLQDRCAPRVSPRPRYVCAEEEFG